MCRTLSGPLIVPIQQTGTLFGQRGVEAALAEFDAIFTTNMTWGRSEQVSEGPNIGFAGGETFIEEFGDFRSSLEKQFADGGLFSISHNWLYSGRNLCIGPSTVSASPKSRFCTSPSLSVKCVIARRTRLSLKIGWALFHPM